MARTRRQSCGTTIYNKILVPDTVYINTEVVCKIKTKFFPFFHLLTRYSACEYNKNRNSLKFTPACRNNHTRDSETCGQRGDPSATLLNRFE